MANSGKKINGKVAPADRKFPTAAKVGGVSSSRRSKAKKQAKPLSIWEKLVLWGGRGKGLPHDLAENHDHYLHGRPKV